MEWFGPSAIFLRFNYKLQSKHEQKHIIGVSDIDVVMKSIIDLFMLPNHSRKSFETAYIHLSSICIHTMG
jgi:hypothetical protein